MEPNQFAILVQSEVENWTALVRYATRQKTISAREPPFGARNLNLMQMIGILKHPFFDLGQIVDFGSGKIYHHSYQYRGFNEFGVNAFEEFIPGFHSNSKASIIIALEDAVGLD